MGRIASGHVGFALYMNTNCMSSWLKGKQEWNKGREKKGSETAFKEKKIDPMQGQNMGAFFCLNLIYPEH